MLVGRVTRLHHENDLIETDIRPTLNDPCTSIRITADDHRVINQLLVGPLLNSLQDPLDPSSRSKAQPVQLCIVLTIIPTRTRGRDLAPGLIVIMAAGHRERAGTGIGELAVPILRSAVADRLPIRRNGRLRILRRNSRDTNHSQTTLSRMHPCFEI